MRKITKFFLLICFMFVVGCGHTHSYTVEVVKPTCVDKGYTKNICDCGDIYISDEVEALGHDYNEWVVITEATAEKEGSKERTCKVCGYNEIESINKLDHIHTYEEKWTYDSENHYHQANCGHDVKKDSSAHQFKEEVIKESTHLEEGEVKYTCMVCEYTEVKKVATLSHTFSSEYSFDDEYHYYVCVCGEKSGIEEHEYKDGVVVVEETKLTDGLKKYTCKCGSQKEEVIKAIGYEIDTAKEVIYLITTSAGTDISNSVGISWHCKNSGSYLVYKKEGTNEFVKVEPKEDYWCLEEKHTQDPYQNKRYVCTIDLKDLEPNSKYVYKIISGDISSNDISFKTADSSATSYSFLSFVDFQNSENSTTLKLVSKFVENVPEANLITCSGDITDVGYSERTHRYLFDTTVFSSSILAFGAGDHEYYGTDTSPIKMMKRPYGYNRLFNNPDNGCEGYLNTSYYFKYNDILFVFLDCGDSNVSSTNEMFSKQAKWLDNVLTNEKDYGYIIVCMHKSLYGDPKQDGAVRNFAPVFTSVFDKHKVDLVISGHDHEYSRTKPLSNGVEAKDGTVYLDLGNSGNKKRATGEEIKTSNLYSKYIDIKENNLSLGIVGTVVDGKLKIVIRNLDFTAIDGVEIVKKNR